ncbi:MAG TPA: flagellar basal body P-ring protein FlgI [Candidatus Baltobacteraceae bacterium]|jgi:flagellar P-ring protein precursor FlgI|nr:flagellar basal body P-ring protein FlgI [Candidatus Baltobacteraceae bacterium]
MRRALDLLILFLVMAFAPAAFAGGARVKDIAVVAGALDNQLVGYGLVVGLAGDGDKNPTQTLQTLVNILQRFGLTVPASTISAKNVAVVMVTADIPAFMKLGSKLDVTVSSMGDAKSIQGGVLIQTPLLGADGKVYAVAQGALALGAISAGTEGGGGASVQKNHPTVGQIADGAIVEREIPAEIVSDHHVELLLREPDFTTASRMAAAINVEFADSSQALDSTTVRVRVPEDMEASPIDFISRLELVELEPDVPARIVINERTGTIVATSRIRIASCAVSHGNLTISITSTLNVSQPGPFSNTGQTIITPTTQTKVKEEKAAMVALPELPTVEKVASALNSLGVTPRDMMSMFEAMKQAGALQAELIIR